VNHLPIELWHWAAFDVLVVVLLVVDLVVFRRKDHEAPLEESI